MCVFCEPSGRILYEDDWVYAMFDHYPVNPGHVLIIPKRHVVSVFDTTPKEREAMLEAVTRIKPLVDKAYQPLGYNVGINDGTVAGQTIMHCHVHVIPRYEGDVSDPRGGIRGVIPNRKTYKKNTA